MSPMNANMNGFSHHQKQMYHPLKITKDSHMIKKSSSTTSSSSSSPTSSLSPPPLPKPQQQQQRRHPVIIYTHSPKIIHTHPKDFMALVQKLTGMSRIDQEDDKKKINMNNNANLNLTRRDRNHCHEDNESLSGITTSEEMCSNGGDNGQVNSNCLGPPPHMVFHQDQLPNSFMPNLGLPFYTAGLNNNNHHTNNSNNCNELLCCTSSTDPTYDFIDFNLPTF